MIFVGKSNFSLIGIFISAEGTEVPVTTGGSAYDHMLIYSGQPGNDIAFTLHCSEKIGFNVHIHKGHVGGY